MKVAADISKRKGYRLPTAVEWEYASRAFATTTRFFAESHELLGSYAWFNNSASTEDLSSLPEYRARPVGQLMPNDFGLFDIYGNAVEWCHNSPLPNVDKNGTPVPQHQVPDLNRTVAEKVDRAQRGGHYSAVAPFVCSPVPYRDLPNTLNILYGFRIARTEL